MDPVLCGSPACHSACRTQVDVRLSPSLIPAILSNSSFSYKDFSECFPLWCEEQPNGAEGVFNTVSSFIETHIVVCFRSSLPLTHTTKITFSPPPFCLPLGPAPFLFLVWGWRHKTNTNKLFEQYEVQKNVDILHQVVTEARARRQRGETGGGGTGVDSWRADLQPRAAVRAKTIPALERERDSLRTRLAQVRFFFYVSPSLTPSWL